MTRAANNRDFAATMRRKRGEPDPIKTYEGEGQVYFGVDPGVEGVVAKVSLEGTPITYSSLVYGAIRMKNPGKMVILDDLYTTYPEMSWYKALVDRHFGEQQRRKENAATREREGRQQRDRILIAAALARSIG